MIKSAIIQNSRYGVKDRCLSFDGTDDYVDCGNASSLKNLISTITWEAWFKSNSATDQTLFSKWYATNNYRMVLCRLRSDGRLQFYFSSNGVDLSGTNAIQYITPSGTNYGDDAWYHIALIWNSTGKCYINGVEISLSVPAGTYAGANLFTSDANYTIGAQSQDSSTRKNVFNGKIDEVRIWDHARTADQIKRYMHTRLYGTETGLMAYYPMNEGTGSTAYDKSTNSNDGTITGATWIKP
jgi:hypothetical protein